MRQLLLLRSRVGITMFYAHRSIQHHLAGKHSRKMRLFRNQ